MEQETNNQPEDVRMITKNNGVKYTVRNDRRRFFYPSEYEAFRKTLKTPEKQAFFDFLIHTGARVDEALHTRMIDFDFERNNVRLWKTKTKAKKGEKVGKPRTISLSSEFCKRIKKVGAGKSPEEYLWPMLVSTVNKIIKSSVKKAGIKDYHNFSSHNFRKTHGMYLKALGIDVGEICTRLGHDYNTYIAHYGSADVFNDKDMRQIKEILGDLYMRQRRF